MSGTIVLGNVYLHRDLLPDGDNTCFGGGLWKIDNQRGIVILYGRSFDFGAPEFSEARRIDRFGLHGLNYPLFYQRQFAGEEFLEPILL